MKRITKAAWDRVIEKACDVTNATRTDDDPMYDIYREQMLELLDEIEAEFGTQSKILDTRADYIDDPHERRRLCTKVLELARAQNDQDEIAFFLQSLDDLEEDLVSKAKRNGKKTEKKPNNASHPTAISRQIEFELPSRHGWTQRSAEGISAPSASTQNENQNYEPSTTGI